MGSLWLMIPNEYDLKQVGVWWSNDQLFCISNVCADDRLSMSCFACEMICS
jgi:hypothetical protein